MDFVYLVYNFKHFQLHHVCNCWFGKRVLRLARSYLYDVCRIRVYLSGSRNSIVIIMKS